MILVNLRNGTTLKLDPEKEMDRQAIEHPYNQSAITRVSIIDLEGHRVDMPPMKSKSTRVWIETLSTNGVVKGERISMRFGTVILQATLYFSDGRVVIDYEKL